jgi:Domain of unknown function DUF11
MPDRTPFLDWRRNLLASVGLALLLLALFYLFAAAGARPVQAQGTLRLEIKKTLEGSDVVRVGQYLTFTIRITNTGTISIAQLPLFDDYEAQYLRLERATPPPTTSSPGSITWTNLPTATLSGPLAPGQSISVVTVFRVIAASDGVTVNAARTGTLLGVGGQSGAGGDDSDGGTAVGGRVIVEKGLAAGAAPFSGQPLTFTITISNDGAADIVRLPLQDTFSTEYLQFWRASPRPTSVDPAAGELRWDDLLPVMGLTRLRPGQLITVTTVFTALKSVDGAVVNRAGAIAVRDEFGNEVAAPRQTEIPIRILPGAGEATPTPRPRPRDDKPSEESTPTVAATQTVATAIPEITATIVSTDSAGLAPTAVTLTPVEQPQSLPRTGKPAGMSGGWPLVGLALLLAGALVLLYRRSGAS